MADQEGAAQRPVLFAKVSQESAAISHPRDRRFPGAILTLWAVEGSGVQCVPGVTGTHPSRIAVSYIGASNHRPIAQREVVKLRARNIPVTACSHRACPCRGSKSGCAEYLNRKIDGTGS